ncbi:type VII secretion target [Amycolatopsis suaedae]|uniref:ESX-1 secretion-associated protein n=1 Tax=Amycolatopsis suaedae TaxID=2510978 RepID=A0A4Q7J6I9_9PSEU|nr:type VII secretion target [Amycolatopsis suaedae]RZQ61923.1 ESX-1 secretion-associated protein [Amycolatopsis suaedae]
MTGFNVVGDDLSAHASHLDGLTDRLGTALSAAQTAAMSDDCYGLLCSFIPPIINPMEEQAIDTLKSAQDAMGTTAGNIRTTATTYTERDNDMAQPFVGVEIDGQQV